MIKMTKAEKEFARQIFRTCEGIKSLAGRYYQGQMTENRFLKDFADKVFIIQESFRIKRG